LGKLTNRAELQGSVRFRFCSACDGLLVDLPGDGSAHDAKAWLQRLPITLCGPAAREIAAAPPCSPSDVLRAGSGRDAHVRAPQGLRAAGGG